MDEYESTLEQLNRRAARRTVMVLCFALIVTACGSISSNGANQPGSEQTEAPQFEESINKPPLSSLDQTLSFSRPIEPFDGTVVAIVDDGRVNIVETTSGETLASHSIDVEGSFPEAAYADGAIYIVDGRDPGEHQLFRIDAGGVEVVGFETGGWIEHLHETPQPSMVAVDDDYAELIRMHPDGQIDRHIFESGIFVEGVGDTILLTTRDYTGEMWLMDQDLAVINGFSVGKLQNRPILIDEATVRIATNTGRYSIDLATQDLEPYPNTERALDPLISEFAEGWIAELITGTLTVTDPGGVMQVEQVVEPATRVSSFAHPTENTALVALRSCANVDGDICGEPSDGDAESSGDSDEAGDEIYVPPGFLNIFQLDMDTGTLVELEIGQFTSMAALAVDSGWLAAGVDGSTTSIITIDRSSDAQILDELPNSGYDFTLEYVAPVGEQGLALLDRRVGEIVILTNDGLLRTTGTALSNGSVWRGTADSFSHLG